MMGYVKRHFATFAGKGPNLIRERRSDSEIEQVFPCYLLIVSLLRRNHSLLFFTGGFGKNPHGCCVQ